MKKCIIAVSVLTLMLMTMAACSMAVPALPKSTVPTAATETNTTTVAITTEPTTAKLTFESTTMPAEAPTEAPPIIENEPDDDTPSGQTYILNTNSLKFHYPGCSSASKIKDSNKEVFNGTREEVIARGYEPCKRCNP